jgi:hypothetical protein
VVTSRPLSIPQTGQTEFVFLRAAYEIKKCKMRKIVKIWLSRGHQSNHRCHAKNVKFNIKFDTFFHGLLTKRDKLGDHWPIAYTYFHTLDFTISRPI